MFDLKNTPPPFLESDKFTYDSVLLQTTFIKAREILLKMTLMKSVIIRAVQFQANCK